MRPTNAVIDQIFCPKASSRYTRAARVPAGGPPNLLRHPEVSHKRRRTTARRQGRGFLRRGEGQSRGPRSPLRDFPTRTWAVGPRPWPGPGMCGGANPQDRVNHLPRGKGGRKAYIVRRGIKKKENSVIRPGEPLHLLLRSKFSALHVLPMHLVKTAPFEHTGNSPAPSPFH